MIREVGGLGGSDLRQARDVMDVILRPPEFDDFNTWRRAVLSEVKALMGADLGGFMFAMPGGHDWVSDYPQVKIRGYDHRIQRLASGEDVWRRHLDLGVHSRDEVWLPIRPDFYETEYYQDFLRPLRAFDALGVTWLHPRGGSCREACQFLVHHETERGRRFGAREKSLFALLFPALRAGSDYAVVTARRAGGSDEVAQVVLDGKGDALHMNPAATTLLEAVPGRSGELRSALKKMVRICGSRNSASPPSSSWVQLSGGAVQVSLVRIPLGGDRGTGYVAALRVGDSEPPVVPAGESRAEGEASRAGLTPRQFEVALLLARGKSNKAVARTLGIAPATARRHTEQVLSRLGVPRRSGVAAALLKAGVDFVDGSATSD
ncbi:MAG: response regulator transcription factor [Gemmatimonadota bacterium]